MSCLFFCSRGWADLLASLPAQQLKIFPVVHTVWLLRVFGISNLPEWIRSNQASSALYLTVFSVILVLELGSVAIIYVESADPQANIKRATDGIWWGFVTIATVGYGDLYPVTNTGRSVGMIVMTLGVGLFGLLTDFLANAILPANDDGPSSGPPLAAADRPDDSVMAEFRRLIEGQERTNATLKAQSARIEMLLDEGRTPTA